MKILVFAGHFYPNIGGYENFINDLCLHLQNRGHEIDILTTNPGCYRPSESNGNMTIYRMDCWDILGGTYPILKISACNAAILLRIWEKQYDLVNTHTRFFSTSLLGALFSLARRIPLVHVEHGSTHSILDSKLISVISVIYDHFIGWMIVNSSRSNVGISKSSCSFLRHIGGRKIVCIPDGVDLGKFKRKLPDGNEDSNLEKGSPIITFVGRLIYAKGVQDLIWVFPILKEKYPEIKLLIVGDGPYRKELEAMADNEKDKSIVFLGSKTQEEVADVLNITDIFINPTYSEGFGMTVLEAGAMGLPIIATKEGAIPEIIDDHNSGILIDVGSRSQIYNAVIEIIDNPSLRERLSNGILSVVRENYGWDNVVDRYERLFIECKRNQ